MTQTKTTVPTDHIITAIRETLDYPNYAQLRQDLARAYAREYWGDDLDQHPADVLRACLRSTAEISGNAVADLLESAMK